VSIAFYVPDGGRFRSTEWTRGPWDPGQQHAGPPTALLGRAIERLDGSEEFTVARLSMELLRSVPLAVLTVEARVVRAGRRVQLAEATLSDDDGAIALARAWRIRRDDTVAEESANEPPGFAGPEESLRSVASIRGTGRAISRQSSGARRIGAGQQALLVSRR
jgi:Thioesterase-like superfamily